MGIFYQICPKKLPMPQGRKGHNNPSGEKPGEPDKKKEPTPNPEEDESEKQHSRTCSRSMIAPKPPEPLKSCKPHEPRKKGKPQANAANRTKRK